MHGLIGAAGEASRTPTEMSEKPLGQRSTSALRITKPAAYLTACGFDVSTSQFLCPDLARRGTAHGPLEASDWHASIAFWNCGEFGPTPVEGGMKTPLCETV
jgi:hypothetical protein